MGRVQKVKRVNPYFKDAKCVKVQMDITWKQYDLLKNALLDYSQKFSNRDMTELLNMVRG